MYYSRPITAQSFQNTTNMIAPADSFFTVWCQTQACKQLKLTGTQDEEERRNYLINNTNTPSTEEYTDKKRHTPLLRALAAQPPGEGEIFGLDRHALRVDRSEVGVLEERDEVRLGRLLQRHDGGGLEAQVGLCGAP